MSHSLRARRVAAAFALLPLAFSARAAHIQIEAGRSYMDRYAANTLFAEAVLDAHPIGNSRWRWAPDVSLGWIHGRELARYRGSRYGNADPAWLLAAGARVSYGDAGHWYRHLFLGFQPALNSARTLALSSPYEFVSTLGWQGRHFSFQIRHVSNGDLHKPNRGETMALFGVGFDL